MMSNTHQIKGPTQPLPLPLPLPMSDLLLATGVLGRAGLSGAVGCCGSANLASAGWMSDAARQARATGGPDDVPVTPDVLIEDAALHAPFAGLEFWLSLAALVFTVTGAILAYLMWISGPGFLVLFVLLLFASGPFYLKGLDYLAGIDRKKEV